MPQALLHLPRWFSNISRKPRGVVARLRYRLLAWTALPAPAPHEHVRSALTDEDDTFRQLSFTFAVIALSARVATADAPLSKEKYVAFREAFPLSSGICGKIRNLFALACNNHAPTEHYVQQMKYMYPGKDALFASVVERLFRIASADRGFGRKSEFLLADIAHGLGLNADTFAEIRARFDRPATAAAVLGVEHELNAAILKKRYHELMRRYHPDRFEAEHISDEMRLLLRAKTTEINAAYRILSKKAA